MLADKTRNIYKVSKDKYSKLLKDNITKDYRLVEQNTVDDINREAKQIAAELGLADRIEAHSEKPAFITLKDHKHDFQNDPTCRLINPAKSQIGIISKQILQKNTKILRKIIPQQVVRNKVAKLFMFWFWTKVKHELL